VLRLCPGFDPCSHPLSRLVPGALWAALRLLNELPAGLRGNTCSCQSASYSRVPGWKEVAVIGHECRSDNRKSQDLMSSEHVDDFFSFPLSVLQVMRNPVRLSGLPCPSSSLIYSCQLVSRVRRGLCFPRAVAFDMESLSVSYIRKTWCILNPVIFPPLRAAWKPARFGGCRTAAFLSLLSAVRYVGTTLV